MHVLPLSIYEQIDHLLYTIMDFRAEGEKTTSPNQVHRAMLAAKRFSSKSGLNFTEVVALAVRRGFVSYNRDKDALYECTFSFDPEAQIGKSNYIPRM